MHRTRLLLHLAPVLLDALAVSGGFWLARWLRMERYDWFGLVPPISSMPGYGQFVVILTLGIILIFFARGLYRLGGERPLLRHQIAESFWAYWAAMSLVLSGFFFFQFYFFSRFIFAAGSLLGLSLLWGGRAAWSAFTHHLHTRGYARTRVVLIGQGQLVSDLQSRLEALSDYDIVSIVRDLDHLALALSTHHPDQVILASQSHPEAYTESIMKLCHRHHAAFRFIPDEATLDMADLRLESLGGYPIISLHGHRMFGWSYLLKRTLDYVGALFGGLLISPFLLVVAVLVYRECPSVSPFYASRRVGRNGREFWCYKFRTMVPNADQMRADLLTRNERAGGVMFKMDNDPRITPLGRFLRRTSIDELPNLFNVLRGEMSLVGPRPHITEEVELYHHDDHRILSVLPGLTGYAQVHGRSGLSYTDEMRFETFYVHNWSLWLDLTILVRTMAIVLTGKNAT